MRRLSGGALDASALEPRFHFGLEEERRIAFLVARGQVAALRDYVVDRLDGREAHQRSELLRTHPILRIKKIGFGLRSHESRTSYKVLDVLRRAGLRE